MAPSGSCSSFFVDKGVAEHLIDEGSYAKVPPPPFDNISSIRYSPTNPDQLLLSSWDTVRYLASFFFLRNPLKVIADSTFL